MHVRGFAVVLVCGMAALAGACGEDGGDGAGGSGGSGAGGGGGGSRKIRIGDVEVQLGDGALANTSPSPAGLVLQLGLGECAAGVTVPPGTAWMDVYVQTSAPVSAGTIAAGAAHIEAYVKVFDENCQLTTPFKQEGASSGSVKIDSLGPPVTGTVELSLHDIRFTETTVKIPYSAGACGFTVGPSCVR